MPSFYALAKPRFDLISRVEQTVSVLETNIVDSRNPEDGAVRLLIADPVGSLERYLRSFASLRLSITVR